MPVSASMPIVESMKPMHIAMTPFRRLPSASVMVATSAKSISENISAGPKRSAASAMGPVRKTRKSMPIVPPMNEAMAEMASAAPASPFFVIG